MDREFVVSALKYRPDTFDSVVGQHSITTTLKNAIKNDHLGKAFLFCGPRGVGKTTCARILGKVINCSDLTENIEPCGQCESCRAFQEGHSLNIHELDAASNNKVEHIRDLIDQVRLAPQIGSYKVYIIDEVHMLSQQAFNAFLKTLEEPPEHAIFILATTEKHKVLPTILSRCQIFDFNRIGVNDMADHLDSIAKKEGIDAEYEGLNIIAQKADGALRDALSIFDQIVASSGKTVSYKDVVSNLNILDHDHYFKVVDSMLNGDVSSTLLQFDGILRSGFDGQHFLSGLADHFRDLLLVRDKETLQLLQVSDPVKEQFFEQARIAKGDALLEALDLISEADTQYRTSKNQRLLVELTLMKIAKELGGNGVPQGEMEAPEPSSEKKTTPEPPPIEQEAKKEEGPHQDTEETSEGSIRSEEKEAPSTSEEPLTSPEAPTEQEKEPSPSASTDAPLFTSEQEDDPPNDLEEHSPISGGSEEPQEQVPEASPAKKEGETSTEGTAEPEIPKDPEPSSPPPQEAESKEARKEEEPPVSTASSPKEANATTQKVKPSGNFKAGSPSIQDFMNPASQKQEEDEEGSVLDKPKDEFTQEAMVKAWENFVETIKGTNKTSLFHALNKVSPKKEDNSTISIKVDSKFKKQRIDRIKLELLESIRKELNNYELDLRIDVEEEESRKEYYTAKEQYERMEEKNPRIKDLKDLFDLDLDR